MDLSGRTVIVTGGGRHLGRAYCLALAEHGASVVVADLLPPDPVVQQIKDAGGTALGVQIDVTQPDTLTALAEQAVSTYGQIDVLFNNAGYFKQLHKSPLEEIDPDEWDRCFQINVKGTWNAVRAVVPHMKQRRYGHIINVGSTTVHNGIPGFLHYVSAKAAIHGLTRALARELGDYNITVNTLVPDLIPDPEQLAADPENNERALRGRCLKRTETPEDMLGAALLLCSPASDFITGQTINVNGGNVFQ